MVGRSAQNRKSLALFMKVLLVMNSNAAWTRVRNTDIDITPKGHELQILHHKPKHTIAYTDPFFILLNVNETNMASEQLTANTRTLKRQQDAIQCVNTSVDAGLSFEPIFSGKDFSHDEDFLVNICITNHLKQDRFLMSYGTQFEIPGLLNNIFKCDKSCGFKGPEIEREKIKDFMRLKGQHKSCAKHNIARYLVFPKADIYNIQVTLNAMFIAAETTVEAKSAIGNGIDPSSCQITQATLISKPYTLKVRDGREIMKSIQEHSNHKSSASKEEVKTFHRDEAHSTEFYQCGSDKISALQGAIDKARNFSTDAHASVEDFSHGDTWESIFGDYDVGNHKYTEHVFLNAKLYLSGESYNFHCNGILCQEREDVFAYVYSTDANHVIYVCDRFFSAPNSKVHNSQPGILIHEVTHFNDVGNTLDFAYGLQAVNNLADSNPMKARRNADSYELYAETAGGSDTINDPKNVGFHDFLKSKQAIILCSVIVGGFFITVFCFICCMMCLKSGPRRGEHIPDQSRQVLSASSRRRSKAPERRRTNSRPRKNENKAARYTVDP